MRRLAVVGAAETPRAWVAALPSAGVRWLDRLADAPLEQIDVLWVRQMIRPDARVLPWLRAGGRLLATGTAVRLVSSLGLESLAPGDIALPDPLPQEFGLAGFGAHPLFAGLRDGAMLRPERSSGPTMTGYERTWPSASVVAVERRGLALDPGRVLAWEYAVGGGGLLCLAVEPAPGGETTWDDELVLANALVGEGIPHRDRVGAAVHWPRPGRRAARASGEEAPATMPASSSGVWAPSSLDALDLAPAADWAHAGRRQLIRARGGPAVR
jgi:hypothetical protein